VLAIQASRTGWAPHADAPPAATEKVVLAPVAAEVVRELSLVVVAAAAAARESRRETERREYCMVTEERVVDSLLENESSERTEGCQRMSERQ
jgi:hypothetical protein